MRVLLLNSPIYRENPETNEKYLPPLGLGYIAAHLNEANIDVEIVDCVNEHIGIVEIFELLVKVHPDFLAMNIFTQNLDIVQEIAENCPITLTLIIGGQVVKSIYNEILSWELKNKLIIVIGESELILPDIINSKCTQEAFYKSETKYVYRVDSSSAYFPHDINKVNIDRSFLKNVVLTNHYREHEVSIITSRGCPYDCAFCGAAHSRNCDIKIRHRTNEHISLEIRNIISSHPKVKSIRILDDLFLRDIQSINMAIELFEEFESLSWRGMAHILTFAKALGLLHRLRQSGCRELFIGVESGSDSVRQRINKAGGAKKVLEVVTAVLNSGIDVKIYLMYGFPKETYEEANETYLLAKKIKDISRTSPGNFRTSVFQFRPYHGTKLYDEIVESGKTIGAVKRNEYLNVFEGRAQFNFQSGNYSDMSDAVLNELILKTQSLSEGFDD